MFFALGKSSEFNLDSIRSWGPWGAICWLCLNAAVSLVCNRLCATWAARAMCFQDSVNVLHLSGAQDWVVELDFSLVADSAWHPSCVQNWELEPNLQPSLMLSHDGSGQLLVLPALHSGGCLLRLQGLWPLRLQSWPNPPWSCPHLPSGRMKRCPSLGTRLCLPA